MLDNTLCGNLRMHTHRIQDRHLSTMIIITRVGLGLGLWTDHCPVRLILVSSDLLLATQARSTLLGGSCGSSCGGRLFSKENASITKTWTGGKLWPEFFSSCAPGYLTFAVSFQADGHQPIVVVLISRSYVVGLWHYLYIIHCYFTGYPFNCKVHEVSSLVAEWSDDSLWFRLEIVLDSRYNRCLIDSRECDRH